MSKRPERSLRTPWVDISAIPNTYVANPLVGQNVFLTMPAEEAEVPSFGESKELLPSPHWEGHENVLRTYWRTWELAFGNLRTVNPESGFVANFIDTAFNDCTFMWDSCFMLMFGRYGSRAFSFLRTLDNFYARQHADGFICREIGVEKGDDRFFRFDPASTGPGLMPWTEWEYYLNFGDRERLARAFPVLLAYHQWFRAYRTWPDGSYWGTGWATGMDNQPRPDKGVPYYHAAKYHQHMTWVDVCLQQLLSAKLLVAMGRELGREAEAADMRAEAQFLARYVNARLWDEETHYYYDRRRDGTRTGVKSIGAYWALLAGAVPRRRLAPFVAHLENPREFKRPHRVPSLSADDPHYDRRGGYWLGSVWPPTNYMVLRGLTQTGYHTLAHEIARNHLDNVVAAFEKTRTVFENYAPEAAAPGNASRKDFVGWGGLGPIAVLMEYVFGLRADVRRNRLVWDVNLLEAHGVTGYPFGRKGLLTLRCAARASADKRPRLEVESNVPLKLEVRWPGGKEVVRVPAPHSFGSGGTSRSRAL